jgi:carotenoid cleavage dioxygenase-like enzyme
MSVCFDRVAVHISPIFWGDNATLRAVARVKLAHHLPFSFHGWWQAA